jgi:glycosyltransferase involved in cell wall biosynthesis
MRVAVVTHYFPTSVNPWAGHSAYQTMRILAKQCDLHVFYPVSTYPAILTPPSRRGGSIDRNWRPGEVDVTYIPYPALPVITRALNGFVIAHTLLPHVRCYRPDIILNYVVYPNGFAAVRIARALGVPSVVTAIGSDLNRMADPLCAALTRSTLRNADFVTTVSNDLANTARRLGANPDRCKPKLNGCDTSIFYPADRAEARLELGLDPQTEIILYVGRLDFRKGLVELIDAMVSVRATRPQAHCYIIGDGPDKGMLRTAIEKHHLESCITLAPSCVSKKVARWMAACDVVTLPSYNEGCPNVVLEALSAGRPVVATRVGGIPELMDDRCGRLVAARNVPELAEALEDTLIKVWDASLIASMRSRGWADVSDDLLEILKEALARPLSRPR